MENKQIGIYSLLILLIFIVGIGVVSAGDINTTDATPIVENDNVDTIMSDTADDDVMVGKYAQKDLTKKEIDGKKIKAVGVEKTATKITVNSIGDVQKDNYVTLTGKYTAATGINLTYTPIKIVINGATYTNKTNGNGIYSYTFKVSTLGNNNVTVSYAGNSRFIGDSAKTTFKVLDSVKTATKITVNSIGDVQKDAYVTVTGRYTAVTGINLTYTPIRILINGVAYTNKTNGNGIYSYNFKASTLGTNNVSVSYAGNARFIGASASTKFNVVNKTGTKITVNTLEDVQKDSYVTVTGRYTAVTGINLTYTPIKIVINGATYTNKTNGNGIYSYTFKASTLGTNNVSVSYAGNARFIGASASTKFNVVNKTATKITVNSLGTVQKDSYVTVTGRYTAVTGINLTYTPIKIVINGVTYTNKTNGNGIYSYTFKASTLGTNNVSVSYAGNARFIGASASTTFNVVNKTATKITVNSLGTVQKDSYVTVTGRYTAVTGINLTYTPIRITINGVTYTNKTDAYGIYSYTFKASSGGVNNITVSYPGNARFIGATAKTTFNVMSKTTKIYLGASNIQYSEYVTIWGDLYLENFKPITYTTITLDINGQKYYTKTDEYGYFEYKYKPNNVGTYAVTATYSGNEKYSGTSAITQFYVKPKDTRIELNDIYYDYQYINNESHIFADITGKFVDNSGNPLTYTTLNINYGEKNYKVKTDSMGEFIHCYNRVVDEYELITISYSGNEKYTGTSVSNRCGSFDTLIELEDIYERRIDDTITIKGYVKDILRGYTLYGIPVTITLNGKSYSTYTSTETGYFEYSFKADKIGINNLTVTYVGSYKFTTSMNKTTFIVLPKSVDITVINTVRSSDGEYIKIQGRIYDSEGNVLKNVPINLKIDENKYTVMTDNTGLYSYNYKNSSTSIHDLIVAFEGNTDYSTNLIHISFIPQVKDNEIELLLFKTSGSLVTIFDEYNSFKKIGTDTFFGGYREENLEYEHEIFLYHEGKDDFDLRPANKITSLTFYFNNTEGNIISVLGKKDYYSTAFYVEQIEGYTPYKVIVKFRARTPEEIIYDDDYDPHKY